MVAGEETAYRTFHDAYFSRLLRYLLVVTHGDEQAAREALQAAFVRVVRHIRIFDEEQRFWNWLTVLARSALADQRKNRRRYWAFLDRFRAHSETELGNEQMDGADVGLLAQLDRSVIQLPDDERDLLERKYFVGQSVREIALAFQTSEKAVESRLGRVRQKLKTSLLTGLKHEATD